MRVNIKNMPSSLIDSWYQTNTHFSFIINQIIKGWCLSHLCQLLKWWFYILSPVSHKALGWWLLSQFPQFVIFRFFQYHQNTRYLLNIAFIFDRCRRSSAAVAPVKYKFDSNNVRGTFARTKILHTEKLRSGAFSNPFWLDGLKVFPCHCQGCTKLKSAWGLNFKIHFQPDFQVILCCLVGSKIFISFWVIHMIYRHKNEKWFDFHHTEMNMKITFWWSLWTMALINCKGNTAK